MNKKLLKKYKKAMIECSEFDPEARHENFDKILCELLRELGYGELIDIFESYTKWYA